MGELGGVATPPATGGREESEETDGVSGGATGVRGGSTAGDGLGVAWGSAASGGVG